MITLGLLSHHASSRYSPAADRLHWRMGDKLAHGTRGECCIVSQGIPLLFILLWGVLMVPVGD